MKFTRENSMALMIRSVSADGIRIGDQTFSQPISLTPDSVRDDWPGKAVTELDDRDFADILDGSPEVIVLGTGLASIIPPRELVFAMARRGIGFEVMDTAAAARTFNVLAGEGRNVAAVLYIQ